MTRPHLYFWREKQSLLLGLFQLPRPLCCPECPSSCPTSISVFHILFPCLHNLQLVFSFSLFLSFFFSPNRRKASPPNLIPTPLSQADVTFTSVRLLNRPVSSSPADVAAAAAAATEGKSKAQIPLLAATRTPRASAGRGPEQRKRVIIVVVLIIIIPSSLLLHHHHYYCKCPHPN